jgi:hypothetical protein
LEVVEVDAQMGGKTVFKKAVCVVWANGFFQHGNWRAMGLARGALDEKLDAAGDRRRPAHPGWDGWIDDR